MELGLTDSFTETRYIMLAG